MNSINLDRLMEYNIGSYNSIEAILVCLPYRLQLQFAVFLATQLSQYVTISKSIRILNSVEILNKHLSEPVFNRLECYERLKTDDNKFLMSVVASCDQIYNSAFRITNEMNKFVTCYELEFGEQSSTDAKIMFSSFLRNLILENLTDEQKENWLLVANI